MYLNVNLLRIQTIGRMFLPVLEGISSFAIAIDYASSVCSQLPRAQHMAGSGILNPTAGSA